MKKPYFTVWYDSNDWAGWRYTLWAANGQTLAESTCFFSTKSNARAGCRALMRCFPGRPELEIFNAD